MEKPTNKQVYFKLWDDLDYWCDQYKIANDINHDQKECERISKNIRLLQEVMELYKR